MRNDAVELEERRLENFGDLSEYDQVHERHRIFPAVFEGNKYGKVIDLAAGMGVVGKNIRDHYECDLIVNDISPKAIKSLKALGLNTTSFSLDDPEEKFPFPDGHFDAVVTLATIEHLINVDHFLSEIHRILKEGGHLYLSAPNYTGLTYLVPFLISGRTFHNPLSERDRYEFYAHVRYFTYRTLLEFLPQFGLVPEKAFIGKPEGSSRFNSMKKKKPVLAFFVRHGMTFLYRILNPRWASEPVIRFEKKTGDGGRKIPKKIL